MENTIDKQMEALNNSLNYHDLTGFKIYEYWQQDKRIKKKMYFLTDDKGNSLTGHWDFSELNSFIRGYGNAVNKWRQIATDLYNVTGSEVNAQKARNSFEEAIIII